MRKGALLPGGTTVFFAMTLMALLSVFFTLAEGIRLVSLKRSAGRVADLSTEGVFSRYVDFLWTEYGILGVDMTCGGRTETMEGLEEHALSYAAMRNTGRRKKEKEQRERSKEGAHYLGLSVTGCTICSYGLLTDRGGIPFLKQAASYEKTALAEDLIRQGKEALEKGGAERGNINRAGDLLKEGGKAMEEVKNPKPSEDGEPAPEPIKASPEEEAKWKKVENPIDLVTGVRTEGALGLVLPSGRELSGGTMDLSGAVSRRSLSRGSAGYAGELTLTDRVLIQNYLREHFHTYLEPGTGTGLVYGTEYIIGGKPSDRENLEAVAGRILALREAQNLAALSKDARRMAEAQSFATVLAGISGNPAIIAAVKWGILSAWAFVESILDLRTIFNGEKVPVIKSPDQWTSGLSGLTECMNGGFRAKSVKQGMSYENYLSVFLAILMERDLGLRSLDLMEWRMQSESGYEALRMDQMIYSADFSWEISGNPLFFSFVSGLPDIPEKLYCCDKKTWFSCLK